MANATLLFSTTYRNTIMTTNPCRACADRYLGCHAKCKRYQSWKKEQDELKRKERIKKDMPLNRRKYNG